MPPGRPFVEALYRAMEDGDGHTAQRYAARNAPSLEALVAAGGDVNPASRTGITPLTDARRAPCCSPGAR